LTLGKQLLYSLSHAAKPRGRIHEERAVPIRPNAALAFIRATLTPFYPHCTEEERDMYFRLHAWLLMNAVGADEALAKMERDTAKRHPMDEYRVILDEAREQS
jgi:hypothetical protein